MLKSESQKVCLNVQMFFIIGSKTLQEESWNKTSENKRKYLNVYEYEYTHFFSFSVMGKATILS